jgi:hydroxyacylglutathione hydrolase
MKSIKSYYKIIVVPLFEDNYSYVVQGTASNKLVLVDPANPTVVLSFLKLNFPQHIISHVLYTHKHWDHAGGSLDLCKELKDKNPDVCVVIGENDRIFV